MEDNTLQGEESDDEWFYESIRRYDDLLMYDVQGDIGCATFYDNSKVLLGVSRSSLHELWLLSVPDKLLLAGRSAGLVKNRDFNLVAAGYTTGSVKKVVRVGSSVVVAEEGGIHLYSIPQSNNPSDVISLTSTLIRGAEGEVALAVSEAGRVYAGDTLSNLTQLDISSENTHKPIEFPVTFQGSDKISEIKCVGHKVFICSRRKGSVLILDQRTDSFVQEVQVQKDTSGLWTMDANQDDIVALASSCGSVSVRDLRHTHKEIYSHNVGSAHKSSQKVTVHLSPSDPLLSVSGFDKTVEIHDYLCGESDGKVFCHDGHRGQDVQGIVTHMWHPAQKKLLFSADDTGKLNAWRFKLPPNM